MRYLSITIIPCFPTICNHQDVETGKKQVPGENLRVHNFYPTAENSFKGGMKMRKEEKQEEKKPIPWEVADPKPPVIQSGHLEQRKAN